MWRLYFLFYWISHEPELHGVQGGGFVAMRHTPRDKSES